LVAWDEILVRYYLSHPASFEQAHVVGCLRSPYIKRDKRQAVVDLPEILFKASRAGFVLAGFDSTYSIIGFSDYSEGLVFDEHLLRLANSFEEIHIVLKEKKSRPVHSALDKKLGPKLIQVYDRMDAHSRITICSNEVDGLRLFQLRI
jgi:hypothetical protein